jgi:hypothetical protein
MLLYRYLGSHTYETLAEAKLKTSRITSFNDPFEFLFVTKGKITAAHAREYVLSRLKEPDFLQMAAQAIPGLLTDRNPQRLLKKNIPQIVANIVRNGAKVIELPMSLREKMADQSTRVVSFSSVEVNPPDEILLWSHYAKMHEGCRIGFEFPDAIKYPFKIFKVVYQEKRFEIDFGQGMTGRIIGQAIVDSAKVKSTAWKYENEYRMLTHPEVCEPRRMPNSKVECFLAFKREWVKTVDFGVRCPEEEIARIVGLIKEKYLGHVICRRAVFHKSEYALEYELC